MSELPRPSARGASYTVHVEPLRRVTDGSEQALDWRYLRVADINGTIVHSTWVRADDLPAEVALAVERAERMWRETYVP